MRYSVVNFAEVKAVGDFRIDAHYWHPVFIRNSALVSPYQKLRDFVCQGHSEHQIVPYKSGF